MSFYSVVPLHKLWLSIDMINKKHSSLFPARNKRVSCVSFHSQKTPNTEHLHTVLLSLQAWAMETQNFSHSRIFRGTSHLLRVTPAQTILGQWAGLEQCPNPPTVSGQERWWAGQGSREHHQQLCETRLPITTAPARKNDQRQTWAQRYPGHSFRVHTERSLRKLGQQEPEQKASTVSFLHESNKALKLSLNRAPGAVGGVCRGGDPSVSLVPDMAKAAALTWQEWSQ